MSNPAFLPALLILNMDLAFFYIDHFIVIQDVKKIVNLFWKSSENWIDDDDDDG